MTRPEGFVTLLFADIEGSSQGLEHHGTAFRDAIRQLHEDADRLARSHQGYYANSTGDGFLLAFASPLSALLTARDLLTRLASAEWKREFPSIRLRVGIHSGFVESYREQYDGHEVWRAHRIMDAAHGSQILLSDAAYPHIRDDIKCYPEIRCEPLGAFRLRDLLAPLPLYGVMIAGLNQSLLPPRALKQERHNLPQEARPFIGRQQELADVLRYYREQEARCVTITGIGGLGKTRLAQQAAAELIDDYDGGVWLVDCNPLRERDEILPAIASALRMDVGLATDERAFYTLLDRAKLLLILDCFEEVRDHAHILDSLLSATRNVACLVTSRQMLGLPREFVYPLDSMSSRDSSAGGRRQTCDSLALFTEAARHVVPKFSLTANDRATALKICQKLEGVPLLLVLAAGWLRVLSLEELLEQVNENPLEVLTRDTGSGVDLRHSDFRNIITGSFRRLPEESGRLLYQLGLFVGGFYLEDAQAVCGETTKFKMVQQLARLGEHSLLQSQVQGKRTRYRLLDTIREYLSATCEDAVLRRDLLACRQRHAAHYAAFARQMFDGMQQQQWAQSASGLWQELGNLRAAIAFSIAQDDHTLILEFAETLSRACFEAGLWSDFEPLAKAAENAAHQLGRRDALARLLSLQGAFAKRRGEREEAARIWKRKLALYEELQDAQCCVDSLCDLALLAHEEKQFTAAQALLKQAARLARQQKQPGLLAQPLALQAEVALATGDLTRAVKWAEQAKALLREKSDLESLLAIGRTLGRVYRERHDFARALEALTEMLRLAHDTNRVFDISLALLEMGLVYEKQSNLKDAARAYVAAERIHADLPSRRRELTRDVLAQFLSVHGSPEIHVFVQEARQRPWQEPVSELLHAAHGERLPT